MHLKKEINMLYLKHLKKPKTFEIDLKDHNNNY